MNSNEKFLFFLYIRFFCDKISDFKVLVCFRSTSSVHCLREPKGVWGLPELESIDHICDIKLFVRKIPKCFLCGAISHIDIVSFDFF